MNTFLITMLSLFILVGIGVYITIRRPPEKQDYEAIQNELQTVYELIKAHELESIKIHPKPIPPQNSWNSSFGGTPYWPKNEDYPKDKKGVPLILLAQINFSELPPTKDFPSNGILQFFISQNNSWGLEYENKKRSLLDIINAPTGYRVIFHEDIIKDEKQLLKETPFTIKKGNLPFDGVYSLFFEKFIDQPSPTDYRFEKIVTSFSDLNDVTIDELFEQLDSSGCKLGGYATFTQDDPRGYNDIGDWVLLFQMDSISENGVDIMWGDAGVANFFIQPNSLKDKDFSKILYNWDCC